MWTSVNHLLCKRGDQSLDPQNPHKRQVPPCASVTRAEMWDGQILRAGSSVDLPRISERSSLKKGGSVREGSRALVLCTCRHKLVHCTHMHIQTHKIMHNSQGSNTDESKSFFLCVCICVYACLHYRYMCMYMHFAYIGTCVYADMCVCACVCVHVCEQSPNASIRCHPYSLFSVHIEAESPALLDAQRMEIPQKCWVPAAGWNSLSHHLSMGK